LFPEGIDVGLVLVRFVGFAELHGSIVAYRGGDFYIDFFE
jgi:hypothetical protein